MNTFAQDGPSGMTTQSEKMGWCPILFHRHTLPASTGLNSCVIPTRCVPAFLVSTCHIGRWVPALLCTSGDTCKARSSWGVLRGWVERCSTPSKPRTTGRHGDTIRGSGGGSIMRVTPFRSRVHKHEGSLQWERCWIKTTRWEAALLTQRLFSRPLETFQGQQTGKAVLEDGCTEPGSARRQTACFNMPDGRQGHLLLPVVLT